VRAIIAGTQAKGRIVLKASTVRAPMSGPDFVLTATNVALALEARPAAETAIRSTEARRARLCPWRVGSAC